MWAAKSPAKSNPGASEVPTNSGPLAHILLYAGSGLTRSFQFSPMTYPSGVYRHTAYRAWFVLYRAPKRLTHTHNKPVGARVVCRGLERALNQYSSMSLPSWLMRRASAGSEVHISYLFDGYDHEVAPVWGLK